MTKKATAEAPTSTTSSTGSSSLRKIDLKARENLQIIEDALPEMRNKAKNIYQKSHDIPPYEAGPTEAGPPLDIYIFK